MDRKKLLGLLGGVVIFCGAVLILALVIVLVVIPGKNKTISVATKTAGTVVGISVEWEETKVHEFHNIKYAKPPVGALRFQPPVPNHMSQTDVVNGKDSTVIECIDGFTGTGSEDCLVLSVRSTDITASKPVLVWIHGGGLTNGSGAGQVGYHFSSAITQKMDMVTVNINYRLAFLGFSSVEELWDADNGVYANNGIRDIVAALDWIQDNIMYFGGDPDSVTVIGESGGATAVLALASSPLANNKFHRGIAQSPAPEMRFTHVEGNTFQRFMVSGLGCTQDTLAERKTCLMDIDADKLSAKTLMSLIMQGLAPNPMQGVAYFQLPTSLIDPPDVGGWIMVDPTVVTVAPRDLASATFTPDKPLLLVISNLQEENYMSAPPEFKNNDDVMNAAIEATLKKLTGQDGLVQSEVYPMYPGVSGITIWSLLSCDIRSTCPTNDVAEEMSKAENRDIYRMYITHRSLLFPAVHAYDSIALFGYEEPRVPKEFLQDADYKFTDHYQNLVKEIAQGKEFSSGWGKFPGSSLVLENGDQISKVTATKPQEAVCDKLESLDLVKYGWQNRK